MESDQTYLIAQERTVSIAAVDPVAALSKGERTFNAYTIADHPDIQAGRSVVRQTVIENLPMYLNLGDSQTAMGMARLYKDEITGAYRLDIHIPEHASDLMDHLIEIADLKAVGFAGIMKKPDGQ